MRPRHLLLSLALAALLPSTAQAEVKTYDLTVLVVLNTTTLTVTGVSVNIGPYSGVVTINDESNASPTLVDYTQVVVNTTTTRTDVFAGLNSFVHTRTLNSTFPVGGQTGTGDSEGFVKWNPLSSWQAIGGRFCKGSNETGNPLGGNICTVLQFFLEGTQPSTIPSPTYDFPLWTFDAQGDFSSDTFLWQISSNGSSNLEYFSSGLRRINIPAMSLVGFGVLGASLMFLGVRALRRRG